MKKGKNLLILVLMSLSLTACGKAVEQENDKVVVEAQDVLNINNNEATNMANPWITSDKQGVLDATGFDMEAPTGATDINYSYMVDKSMAQLTYVYEGADWVYRISTTEALTDISGMNYTWISDSQGKVLGMEAEYMGYSEQEEESEYIDDMFIVQVVNWFDNTAGATYSLSASGKNIDGMDIQVYAENMYSQAQ